MSKFYEQIDARTNGACLRRHVPQTDSSATIWAAPGTKCPPLNSAKIPRRPGGPRAPKHSRQADTGSR